jgi:hypothetical protein
MVFPEEQLIATFTGWDIIKDPIVDAALVDRLLPSIVGSCPGSTRGSAKIQ